MFIARWNNHVIAQSDDCILVENTLYFPPDSIQPGALRPTHGHSVCSWKGGEASYFDVVTEDGVNPGAAWHYAKTGPLARAFEGWFAFWHGVETLWEGEGEPCPRVIDHATPKVAEVLGYGAVDWRPVIPALDPVTPFTGYLIGDAGILVDVLAVDGSTDRESVVAAARQRVLRLTQVPTGTDGPRYRIIAVWGSAAPTSAAQNALMAGHSVLDLGDVFEVFPVS